MRLRIALLIALIGLAVPALLIPGLAWAADCGGATPCACADTVVASRTLTPGVDGVISGACAGPGLVITVSGVVLDLGGGTISGPGSEVDGITIGGLDLHVDNVTIRNGTIQNFKRGITFFNRSRGGAIVDVITRFNIKQGMRLWKTVGYTVEDSRSEFNGDHGIYTNGSDNRFFFNTTDQNATDGIRVEGAQNALESHRARRNGAGGIVVPPSVLGPNFDYGGNQGKFNGLDNCTIDGRACQ